MCGEWARPGSCLQACLWRLWNRTVGLPLLQGRPRLSPPPGSQPQPTCSLPPASPELPPSCPGLGGPRCMGDPIGPLLPHSALRSPVQGPRGSFPRLASSLPTAGPDFPGVRTVGRGAADPRLGLSDGGFVGPVLGGRGPLWSPQGRGMDGGLGAPPGVHRGGGGLWAVQGPPQEGSADLGGVTVARLRDPWARPAVLPCPSQCGSWLAWSLWPQEETRPPSWQALLLETGSRTREWKKASLKLRLFFLAIPEVDAAREVVWPRTRGCQGLPDQSTSEPAPSRTEGVTAAAAGPCGAGRPSGLSRCLSQCPHLSGGGHGGDTPGGFPSAHRPHVLPVPPCDSSLGLALPVSPGAMLVGAQRQPGCSPSSRSHSFPSSPLGCP